MKSALVFSSFFTVTFLLAVQALASVPSHQIDFDQGTGTTEFHAVGKPSAIRINGTGSSPKGVLSWTADGKVSGTLTFDLTSLDTGIAMRTDHMKEKYLETGKYPQAKLTLNGILLKKDEFSKDFSENIPFQGNLYLHGVTKSVSGTLHIERSGDHSVAHAEFQVKITDYAIAVPKFAGITVADNVNLVVDAKIPLK